MKKEITLIIFAFIFIITGLYLFFNNTADNGRFNDFFNKIGNEFKNPMISLSEKTADSKSHKSNEATVYFNRANKKIDNKDYDGAIEDYKKVIELDPEYLNAYNYLAYSYFAKGDFKSAQENCEKELKVHPDNYKAYNNMGTIKHYQKDYKSAIDYYTKAVEIKPDHAKAYNNRGIAKYYLKDYDGAMEDYQKALKVDPNFKSAKENIDLLNKKLKNEKN